MVITGEYTNSSVADIKKWESSRLKALAHEYNLTFVAFGETIIAQDGSPSSGILTLSEAWASTIEPAPSMGEILQMYHFPT